VSGTKIRKNLLLPIAFILTITIAAAVVAYVHNHYEQNDILFGVKPAQYTVGWETPEGMSITLPDKIAINTNGTAVINNKLPDKLGEGTYLYIKTNYQSLEAVVNGEKIYTWGLDKKAVFNQPLGLSCYIFQIPDSDAGKTVELHLTPYQAGSECWVYNITLGDGVSTVVAIIQRDLGIIVLFFLLAAIALIQTVFIFVFRRRVNRQ
jgi:hypothetical protein